MSSRSSFQDRCFRSRFVYTSCAALVLLAHPGYFPQQMIAQEVMQGQSTAGDLECVSYCSSTRLGTVIMEVRIRVSEPTLNEADLRSKVQQQGLEVTVYADGFERGLFATVSAIKPKALFHVNRATATSQGQTKIPGLEKLVITDVATRLDKSAQSFLLIPPLTAEATKGEWVMVRLEGLDPGMAYTYRVPGGGSVVTCQAVLCPVDRVPDTAIPLKRKP